MARGRGIAGAARATVPAGLPLQSHQARLTLATRSPSRDSACPAPRPPPAAPSGGRPEPQSRVAGRPAACRGRSTSNPRIEVAAWAAFHALLEWVRFQVTILKFFRNRSQRWLLFFLLPTLKKQHACTKGMFVMFEVSTEHSTGVLPQLIGARLYHRETGSPSDEVSLCSSGCCGAHYDSPSSTS